MLFKPGELPENVILIDVTLKKNFLLVEHQFGCHIKHSKIDQVTKSVVKLLKWFT